MCTLPGDYNTQLQNLVKLENTLTDTARIMDAELQNWQSIHDKTTVESRKVLARQWVKEYQRAIDYIYDKVRSMAAEYDTKRYCLIAIFDLRNFYLKIGAKKNATERDKIASEIMFDKLSEMYQVMTNNAESFQLAYLDDKIFLLNEHIEIDRKLNTPKDI